MYLGLKIESCYQRQLYIKPNLSIHGTLINFPRIHKLRNCINLHSQNFENTLFKKKSFENINQ